MSFRKHGRKPIKCAVKLTHRDIGEVITETRDISDTGVFVTCRDLVHYISIGDELEAKLYTDTDTSSTTLLKVVRLTEEGVGLSFD